MLFILVANLILAPVPEGTLQDQLFLGDMVRHDNMAQIFRSMILLAGALTCFLSADLESVGRRGEYYAIIIAATLGGCMMSAAADMIMVLVALETTSISLYILAGFLRGDKRSAEAGLKYFLFGAFTSAILLYGMSLLYGFTGQTNLYALSDILSSGQLELGYVLAVIVMLLVGFGFKVAAVPFHFWTPDVYEGAPTPITAFISVASKAASFALLLRFFTAVFPTYTEHWVGLMAALAVLTMTLGNVLALVQRNVKRLLAYSSIAQAGYVLVGVAAVSVPGGNTVRNEQGIAAVMFYMFLYVLTNLTAFAVVILVERAVGSDKIEDLGGLHWRSPRLALAMFLALLSLGGIPPLAGFAGKFFLFTAAMDAGLGWLVAVGVINAIISLYYYLTIAKVMYVDPPVHTDKTIAIPRPYVFSLVLSVLGMILLGTMLAGPWFDWSTAAAGVLGLF
jgi:NADH-quinone oxidoreductase subunit N